MPIQNLDVADIFNRVANLLEIEEANRFRVRSYRDAGRTVSGLSRSVADMVNDGSDLTELPGIGKDLAQEIAEVVNTGRLKQLEELESRHPPGLNEILGIPGIGPKRVAVLHQELGVESLKQLKAAAEKGKIRGLEGFGKKTERSFLEWLEQAREASGGRIPLQEAEQRAAHLVAYLEDSKGIKSVAVAGSFRRRKETVGDLDILVFIKKGSDVMHRFTAYEDVRKVVANGKTRSTVVLKSGLQVDVRVLSADSYGAGLHYFTGSKAHNIVVRKIGMKKKLRINEYGVFSGKKRVAGKT